MAVPHSSPPSFNEVFRKHLDYVWRVARAMVDEASADDVAQEVFLIARRRMDDLEVQSVRGWLYGITRNVARNHRRGRGRHSRAVARLPEPAPAPSPDERVRQREVVQLMDRFIAGLAPLKREAFVLHVIEGLTAAEIAHSIGVPTRTVYSRVRAARTELEGFVRHHRPEAP